MIPISNLFLEAYEDTTSIATEIYGADKKTYINTGSGNVFKLEWGLTTAIPNDTVDHFNLIIKRYDPTLNVYYDIFDKNIGLVHSFFVKSNLLPPAPEQYMLSIYVVAYGKHGSVVTSNIINPYVSKGSGTYVKVESANDKPPVMKRAIAFVNAATQVEPIATLQDLTGRTLFAKDTDEPLAAEATKLLSSDSWNIAQKGYTKDANNEWRTNDIAFEVLVTMGEWNEAGEPVEVIVGKDNNGNDIYEPLYVL